MPYRFVLGGSGSGKSTGLYKFIIEESIKNQNKQYLIIVPDQFTLAVQKQVTNMHPGRCILNVDVLSFSRLTHRIFAETGGNNIHVLDDTGKNLILSNIGKKLEKELTVLGEKLHKPGIIEQIKSLISEFMQYGIGETEIDALIELAKKNMRGALSEKLSDIKKLYIAFQEEIKGRYDTRETQLAVLAKMIEKSALLENCVVVFDGFTGFTPAQHCVLETIIRRAEKVYFSFLWDTKLDPKGKVSEHDLFYLSGKAMDTIRKIGERAGQLEDAPKLIDGNSNKRFANNRPMAHLEKGLFRSGRNKEGRISCEDKIKIYSAANPYEEIKLAAGFIKKLTTEEGYAYRDIAICCGSLDDYIEPIRRVFAENNIPGFIDVRKKVKDNPIIEYINGLLKLNDKRYSYESVFTCIKNVFSGIAPEDSDLLENYCLANGIKGKTRWHSPYFGYSFADESMTDMLNHVETIREKFVNSIPEANINVSTMGEYCAFVREILNQNNISEQILALEDTFENDANERVKEYSKVHDYILYCLEQIEEFIPEEKADVTRFLQYFNSAISELTVGTIPQNVDRILVGDMERTRFSNIKVMMMLGVNEGSIPKRGNQAGILTVNDRQLFEGEIELSPGPREMMYRQRLYLYMNMTQPSDILYMSYCVSTSTGAELQPSYLLGVVHNLYSDIAERSGSSFFEKYTYTSGMFKEKSAKFLRGMAAQSTEIDEAAINAYIYMVKKYPQLANHMNAAAFFVYTHSALGKALTEAMYGTTLSGNISAFQEFYKCPYMYFLKYGIQLAERDKFEFDYNDTGNMIHKVLEVMGERFEQLNVDWDEASDEEIDNLIEDILADIIKPNYQYKLEYSGKNRYGLRTAARVAARSVRVLSYHLKQGDFKPIGYEKRFTEHMELEDNHSLAFRGTIDRVDVASVGDTDYIKVIDYKTGSVEPDLVDVYNGLSLQLPMYMDEIIRERSKTRKSVPAAMLIYSAKDPMIKPEGTITEEKLEKNRLEELITKGFINSDLEVIKLLDKSADEKTSEVVKLKGSKIKNAGDGSLTRNGIYSEEELKRIMNFTRNKITQAGNEIYQGNIAVRPYKKGTGNSKKTGCDYCSYKKICGIDSGLPGMDYRELDNDISKMMEE